MIQLIEDLKQYEKEMILVPLLVEDGLIEDGYAYIDQTFKVQEDFKVEFVRENLLTSRKKHEFNQKQKFFEITNKGEECLMKSIME